MQNRPNHRFDRTDQRPAQASEVSNNTSNDDNPDIDIRTTCDTAPKASAAEHVSSVLPLNCTGSQTQPKGATGVTVETRRKRKSALSLYAQDRHKRAARMLGCALTINDPGAWTAMGVVLTRRLMRMERMSLAYTVLADLEPDDREMVFNAAHWRVV